ncbi:MAG: aromatic ring-hydroxylating dioxygenase subunit alpha [Isosphaeraceae bacterium]|nr:aromatic ring-hydroxylating dioxygenase subunit alpha [Isosphaeraceae bacterium]
MSTAGTGTGMTLPASCYVDSAWFERELERIFGRMWVYVGRAEELPTAGARVVREVAGESLLLVADGMGRPRAFFNVCRHRGTRLCAGDATAPTASRSIQCPYHAWTWDLDGRLVSAPGIEGAAGFSESDYPLHEVRLEQWDGLLFACLDPAAGSLARQLGELPDRFRAWGLERLRSVRSITYDVQANWKLIIQNYSECLHCPIIHPALQQLSHYLSGVNEACGVGDAYLGGKMDLRPGVETMSLGGRLAGNRLPGLDEDQCRLVQYYAVLPNLLLSLHPDYAMIHELRPLTQSRTEVVCSWHFDPESIARAGFDPEPVVAFWDLTNRQDWHVSELSQLGIASRAYRPGPYSPREELLHAFDLRILELMGEPRPVR